ncbi:uncharacterized protein LOC115885569 [Sitophilus oryzae]|uniref:Uncharacterized protein LOC115885569 n=1 Tax=Sitophilus oryzae TaxID=7048 RepID=A0A6J2YBT6_SITOR|nr:uncharacterized protein LOC115885569 [Sitophilus oryzae]
MNEFLKLNWRVKDLADLEPQECFIKDEVVADSLIYKHCQKKRIFQRGKKQKNQIFQNKRFVPGGNVNIFTATKSTLDTFAHEHCLRALKLFQSGNNCSSHNAVDKFAIEMFQKLKPRIMEENAQYQSFVFDQWVKKDKEAIQGIKSSIYLHGKNAWVRKWQRIYFYPQFYREMRMFNMSFSENESIIEFKFINNVLELGTLAKFLNPNLKSECILKCVTLPSIEKTDILYSNLPVNEDKNVYDIIKKYDINLVISASSLKCISDNTDLKARWMIPFKVKLITTEKEDCDNSTKKVVFIDKPFSQNNISNLDLAYISFKHLIKTNFCQVEAFKFGQDEKTITPEDIENSSGVLGNDFESESYLNKHDNKIHHNVNYRIWNIKKTDCRNNLMKHKVKTTEFNVLIRSKLDACECHENGALQPVVLKPKLETQLRYGAKITSKSELAREWVSLFFTPYSNLYRVRLSPTSGEVICVDKCTIQKVAAEAQTHYQYKPQLSLGVLQKVFEELINLEPGDYLLQHLPKHEAFVAILKKDESSTSNDNFDFHAEYTNAVVDTAPKQWLPIDVNYILPSFETNKRLPGMFTPRTIINKPNKNKQNRRNQTKIREPLQ